MTTTNTIAPPIRRPYRSLDAWRGLAALAILLHHGSSSIIIHDPSVNMDPVHVVCWYAYLGVQMFFVISGYCIANAADVTLERGQSIGVYAIARVRRIFPTYYIALAMWLALNQVMIYLVNRHVVAASVAATPINYSPLFWFSNLTLLGIYISAPPAVGQAWTLCYEISFYAIVGVAFLVGRFAGGGARTMLSLLHAITLGCIASSFVWPATQPFPIDLYSHFGLGILVYDWVVHRRLIAKVAFIIAVVLLVTHAAMFNNEMGYNPYPSRVIHLGAATFATLILLLAPMDDRLSKTWAIRGLAIVGGFSYTLYLMHFYVIGVESQVLLRKAFFIHHHYLTLVITTVVALVACWILYFVAERPFLKKRRPARGDLPAAVGVLPPSDASTAPTTS